MLSLRVKSLVFIATLHAVSFEARAAAYEFQFLNLFNSPGVQSGLANDINNRGQVVGIVADSTDDYRVIRTRAVRWDGTTPTALSGLTDSPDVRLYYGVAINDLGQVVGFGGALDGNNQLTLSTMQAIRWDGTTPTRLGARGGRANDINNSGQVVGQVDGDSVLRNQFAVRWVGGTHTALAGIPTDFPSVAHRINDSGQILGYWDSIPAGLLAVRWDGDVPTIVSSYPDNLFFPVDINDAGDILAAGSGQLRFPFVLNKNNQSFELDNLGGTFVTASDLNNRGQAVGSHVTAGGIDQSSDRRAILWNGSVATDLNEYLDARSRDDGWNLYTATAINDHGWIVGQAYNRFTFEDRPYLLSIVPEPQTYAILMTGLGLTIAMVRRRNTHRRGVRSLH